MSNDLVLIATKIAAIIAAKVVAEIVAIIAVNIVASCEDRHENHREITQNATTGIAVTIAMIVVADSFRSLFTLFTSRLCVSASPQILVFSLFTGQFSARFSLFVRGILG